MNKNVKLLGMAAVISMTFASCSSDEMKEIYQGEGISFTTKVNTRATVTKLENLDGFYVYADAEGYDNMFINGQLATKESEGSNKYVIKDENNGSYYWPSEVKNIEFWAYGPKDINIIPEITSGTQAFKPFTPKAALDEGGKEHLDFVVAYAKAKREDSGSGVTLNFNHALSQVIVNAKRGDSSKRVYVKGAWIMNVKGTGTLTFKDDTTQYPNHMSWETSGSNVNYGVTFSSRKTLDKDYQFMGNTEEDYNSTLMLIPQTVSKWDGNADGSNNGAFILLLCRVEAVHDGTIHEGSGSSDNVGIEGETHIHQLFPATGTYNEEQYGYTCVPVDLTWKPGYKYIYNLEFCGANSGAGIYPPTPLPSGLPSHDKDENIITDRPDGKDVGSLVLDNPIGFTVTVEEWTNDDNNVDMN